MYFKIIFIRIIDLYFRIKLKFSDEEQAENNRIGKEYGRQSILRHNRNEHDLTNKIWIQQEAMRALPDKLREAAEILDESVPPPHRPWPLYATPPIKDFNLDLYIQRGTDGEGGSRGKRHH
jgi:hypothetical protein